MHNDIFHEVSLLKSNLVELVYSSTASGRRSEHPPRYIGVVFDLP